MPCIFRIISGPYRGKVFPVEATRSILIGRALEADFTIPDGTIEAFHCRVEFESGSNGRMAKVVALDQRPEKQLEVDGCPFDMALLKSGDRVKIGDTAIEFLEGGKPQDPVAGRPADIGRPCVAQWARQRSGRRSLVSLSAAPRRQDSMAAWLPERRTSGTARPSQRAGFVYWGYSSSEAEKLSSSADR